jgi:hypothetical protein
MQDQNKKVQLEHFVKLVDQESIISSLLNLNLELEYFLHYLNKIFNTIYHKFSNLNFII